jgi:hypothetical protein
MNMIDVCPIVLSPADAGPLSDNNLIGEFSWQVDVQSSENHVATCFWHRAHVLDECSGKAAPSSERSP